MKTTSLLLCIALCGSTSGAQTAWTIPSAFATATIGAGLGWTGDITEWGRSDCFPCGPTLDKTLVGMGAGAALGALIGFGADMKLRQGDSLSYAMRNWLRFSTFMTPVAIGAAGAFAIINPNPDPCPPPPPSFAGTTYPCRGAPPQFASDETVALLGIGGGMVAGYLLQRRFKRALYPTTRVNFTPTRGGATLSFSAAL